MKQIKVSDISVDVVRKDIKNMHLAVYPPTGRVRISAPNRISDEAIRLFAISKISWIRRHQRNFKNQERIPEREYVYRESHYFLGQRYLLNIIEEDAPPKVEIRNKTYIDMYVRPNTSLEKRHKIMTEWYRSELKKIIPDYIEKWEKKTGLKVNEWKIHQMKTKWGSCDIEDRKIILNLELAKKPVHCLEYIIVHEMMHFFERHHNERFIDKLEQYLPNWKKLKNELNKMPLSHADWDY